MTIESYSLQGLTALAFNVANGQRFTVKRQGGVWYAHIK